MADRIEVTGNIVVHHPDKTPAWWPKPNGYVIKEVNVVTGMRTAKMYDLDRQLKEVWVRSEHGEWKKVALP